MLPEFSFNETELLAFALILLRISAFVVSWPLFSVYSVPNHLKVLFAVVLSILLFPVINRSGLSGAGLAQNIGWLAGKEILTGLCLGFMTRLFFFAISVGGNLIATSIGEANGQVFNPTIGAQSSTVEQFYVTIATLLFLSLNGHHFFLSGLVQSFDAIPLVLPSASGGTEIAGFSGMVGKFADSGAILQSVTEAGVKISAPVMVAIFAMNVVMGIVGRAIPQVNVLLTSMSANFMAGIIVMIVAIPALIMQLNHQIVEFADQLFKFMK